MTSLQVLPVHGLGEIKPGDDVGAMIASRASLADGDILVVSSKIVSKALGLAVPATSRDVSVAAASVRMVAARRTPRGLAQIVQAQAGPVMAAAGVDSSNVAAGTLLVLPPDPDGAARDLLARLRSLTGVRLGVVISDTAGRPWREGQTDFALGAAGIVVTDDLRGTLDTYGQPLEVTVRAVGDEIASAADLVKGKLSAIPVAVVRGLPELVTAADGPGAASLLRDSSDDWFRLGHVEAVRASLGLEAEDVAPPAVPPSPVPERLSRVLDVAVAGRIPGWAASSVSVTMDGAVAQVSSSDALALGAFAQRVAAAAWSEGLTLHIQPGPTQAADGQTVTPAGTLSITAAEAPPAPLAR